MKKYTALLSGITFCLAAAPYTVLAADQVRDQDQTRDQLQSQDRLKEQDKTIYGSELMTEQERNLHREQMRNAKTEQERKQIQNEHHQLMQKRAKERGVTLPETPPPRGMGPGKCGGGKCGGGKGPGAGGGKAR